MQGLLRVISLAALALLTAAPAAGAATLGLEHVSTAVAELGAADGVVGPGDSIELVETVRSNQAGAIGDLIGTLRSQTPGVSTVAGTRAFDPVSFGEVTSNPEPFRASIADSLDCGQPLDFSLQLDAGSDRVELPLRVGTGVPGPPRSRESGDLPHSIPNPGVLSSALVVAERGRVKGVRVRIGRIEHPYVGDLKLTLVSPAGTRVVLADRVGGSGDNFVDTVIGTDGAPISGGIAPFSGTFRARGDLARFDGEQEQGTWHLEVSDASPADAGSLQRWGTDVRPATCAARPVAVATATPNPARTGQPVAFDASQSTDPTGTIVRYEWDLDGDGSFETDTGATPRATATYNARSTIPVGVRITNERGAGDAAIVTLSVTEPPVASFTIDPSAPVTGQVARLDGSGSSDPDGTIVRWEWDLDGNGTFERDTQGSPGVTASWSAPGVRTVRLRVTDDNGATGVGSAEVSVLNRAPAAAIDAPSPVTTGAPATLDGSGSSDPDGTVARWEWDLDGDGGYEIDGGSTPTVSHSFATPGEPVVGLRVTDDRGATATTTKTLNVTHPPVARLSATPDPARPGDLVTLSAAGSGDPDGAVTRYDFDLDGDGSFETATGLVASASRAFAVPGTYTVRVRVTDNHGATAVRSATVTVVAPPVLGEDPPAGGGGGDPGGGVPPLGSLPSGPGAPAPGGPLPGGGSVPPTGAVRFTAWLTGAPLQKVEVARRRGVRLGCRATQPALCTLTLTMGGAVARRLGLVKGARSRKPYRLGRASVLTDPGREAAVVVGLTGRVRKALRRVGRTTVTASGEATLATGETIRLSRTVLLR